MGSRESRLVYFGPITAATCSSPLAGSRVGGGSLSRARLE
jgi:hypothetical protein